MPDILIRGMEMPTKGNPLTVLVYPDGTATWKDREYEVHELPAHGDLIDKNELRKWSYEVKTNRGKYQRVINVVNIPDLPVIVLASEEDG